MIRIGIVGTGNIVGISHFHTQGLLHDGRAEIAAVYDARMDGARDWVEEHGLSATVCGSYEALLDCVDAVSICVPNAFHCGYALGAVRAGKHFLVEKPMAVSIEDCRALAEAVKDYGRCNMVGFVYRFSNAVLEARRIVRGQLGQIYTLSAWFGGKRLSDPTLPLEWRMIRRTSGSGALGDFGSHLVDLADFVAGQRYDTVSCMTETVIPQRQGGDGPAPVENDDAAAFVAKGGQGIGSYTVSRTGMDDVMLLITGEGGMVQLSLRAPESLIYWEKKPDGGYTGAVKQYELAPQKPFDGWFDGEMSAFLDCIEGRPSPGADVAQGLYVEEVLHAAAKAAESGRTERVLR